MVELINRNLSKPGGPDYYYRVDVFVSTFGLDKDKTESYEHYEDFKEGNLINCKVQAQFYYQERLIGLNEGKYFLPFASPKEFVFGENSVFSVTLSLVEFYNNENYILHTIMGEDEETNLEGMKVEAEVLNSKGLL